MKRIANLYLDELQPSREWLTLTRFLKTSAVLLVVFLLMWVVINYINAQQQRESEQVRAQLAAAQAQLQQRQAQLDNALNDPELNDALREVEQTLALRNKLLEQMYSHTQQNQQSYSQLLADLAAADQNSVWLQRILVVDNALSIEGRTLKPQGLPDWLASFSRYPSLQGRPFGVFELVEDEQQGLRFVVGHLNNAGSNQNTPEARR